MPEKLPPDGFLPEALRNSSTTSLPGASPESATLREILEAFKAERQDGEIFADWFARTRTTGEAPVPEQFHIELAERAAKLAGQKVGAAE